jgi:hypothetical protein
MTAVYTWDVFSTLDGYGSYGSEGDWGGYWSEQGPELLSHRGLPLPHRAADGLRRHDLPAKAAILLLGDDPHSSDEWNVRMMRMPATVISSTFRDTLG